MLSLYPALSIMKKFEIRNSMAEFLIFQIEGKEDDRVELFPKWKELNQSDTSTTEESSVAGIEQENMTYEEKI